MFKKFCVSLFVLSNSLTLCSSPCNATKRTDSRKRAVVRFLNDWLVRKDIPAALRSFHRKSFTYVSVIDRCAREDYITDADQGNPTAIEAGVRKFLTAGSSHIKGHSLDNILFLVSHDVPEQSAYLSKLRKIAFNEPTRDRYFLMLLSSVKQSFSSKDDWDEFEKRYDLKNAFVSVIQYRVLNENHRYGDDVVVMMLWVRLGASWGIVFVTVPSCSA